MDDRPAVIIADAEGAQCTLDCDHGEVTCFDGGQHWSDDQLVDFASLVLSARCGCDCFGERVWVPPQMPDHVSAEVRLYEVDRTDPDIETTRPVVIPGKAISLAAHRVFESRVPSDDHSLSEDWAMVRYWWRQRQLGLLRDD